MTPPRGPADPQSPERIASAKPWAFTVSLPQPSLQNNTADTDRLLEALQLHLDDEPVRIDFELVRRLPRLLRQWNYHVGCVVGWDRHHYRVAAFGDSHPQVNASIVLAAGIFKGYFNVARRPSLDQCRVEAKQSVPG